MQGVGTTYTVNVLNLHLTNRALFQASVKWLFGGFNATLLAFGQSGVGKSSMLFAEGSHAEQPLFHSILQQIFAQEPPAAQGRRIGFSCWEILQHQAVDLLAGPCQQDNPPQVGSHHIVDFPSYMSEVF